MGIVLKFQDHAIRDRDQTLCLTDMWKAAGSPENKRPNDWLATPMAREFVEFIGENLNAEKSGIALVEAKRGGRDAGTWAHWQIGLAYAKYLSPAFHAWCNQIVRAHMEGKVSRIDEAPSWIRSVLDDLSARLDTTQAEVIDLRQRLAIGGPGTGLIGERDSRVYILGPLRTLAEQVADMRGQSYRKVLIDLDRQVREAADHPKAKKGNKWERLPQVNFGHARRAIFNLQDQHKAELDAHAQRVAASRQMVLKPTG